MRLAILIAVTASGLTASPASATLVFHTAFSTIVSQKQINSNILKTSNTDTFGAVLSGRGKFSNTFGFVLHGKLSSIDLSGVGLDLTSVFLDGIVQAPTDSHHWTLGSNNLTGGPHSIIVNGHVGVAGSGSYTANIASVPAAVPEPATWAMMLIGFGGIGVATRRRRRRSSGPLQTA